MSETSEEEFALEEDFPLPKKKGEKKAFKIESGDDSDDDMPLKSMAKKKKAAVKKEDVVKKEAAVKKDVPPPKKKGKKIAVKFESEDNSDDDKPLKSMAKKKKDTVMKEANVKKEAHVKKEAVVKKETKKRKADTKESSSSSKRGKKEPAAASKPPPKALKKLDKPERLQYAMQSFLWWDAKEAPPGCQWSTMEHAAVSFPETYVPHGICMKYDGKPVQLSPMEEEAASFFAAMDPDGMHLGEPKTAKIFIKNFFADFRDVLGKGHIIKVSREEGRACFRD
jgi:DNA topoisomerase-1